MSDSWLEIAVRAAPSYVDELAGVIASELAAAAAGLEVRDAEVAFWVLEGTEKDAVAPLESLLAALAARGAPVTTEVEVRRAPPEKEWREAYKRYFRVARLSRRIVVVPSWEQYAPQADDLIINLDPGQAFGTGSHATTTLVLRELQRLADTGLHVEHALDVGTGSGILTIAIARLGLAESLAAFDNDPLAVAAAQENCEQNHVAAKVSRRESPDLEAAPCGLIVANIQRHVLLHLAEDIAAAAAPNTTIVLSGLLSHQLDEVSEAYRGCGFREARREIDADDSEWGVLTLTSLPS